MAIIYLKMLYVFNVILIFCYFDITFLYRYAIEKMSDAERTQWMKL